MIDNKLDEQVFRPNQATDKKHINFKTFSTNPGKNIE